MEVHQLGRAPSKQCFELVPSTWSWGSICAVGYCTSADNFVGDVFLPDPTHVPDERRRPLPQSIMGECSHHGILLWQETIKYNIQTVQQAHLCRLLIIHVPQLHVSYKQTMT